MRLTLYIPCFNAEKYIQSCLEAVLKQTYVAEEMLIIDDGSTDKTVDIAAHFPVKIIKHNVNKGLAAARNTALKYAKGEFIASLDADCIPEKDWLKILMRNFSSEVAGAGGRLVESAANSVQDQWRAVRMVQEWGEKKSNSIPFLFGSNNVFRKKVLLDAGGYDEEYRNNYEDVEIAKKIKKSGYVFIYEPLALVHHIKKDDFFSILDTFWNWNFGYHKEKGYYKDRYGLYLKIKENIGLANRFIEEDFHKKRLQFLYFDFLLSIYLSLKDFLFIYDRGFPSSGIKGSLFYPFYLNLFDLTFFYHLDHGSNSLRTFIPLKESSSQNFLVFLLLTGGILMKKVDNHVFLRELLKHFFKSFVKERNEFLGFLSKKTLLMLELHKNWDDFLKKEQPNIKREFLGVFVENFQKWLDNLNHRIPNIINLIEISQYTLIEKEEG